MKNLLLSLCFIPTLALAENPQSMSQEQMNQMMGGQGMQQMMMKMQQLESCMKKIDESLLDKLGERGEKLEQSVTKLCKTGKKSQAQKEFVSFANELNNSKELKQMRICVNKIDLPMIKKQMDDKFNIDTSQNICETLSNR